MIVIADFLSVELDGKPYGHYAYTSKMYRRIFGKSISMVAGGPVYRKAEIENLFSLPFGTTAICSNVITGMVNRIKIILNGLKVFYYFSNDIIIIQPGNFICNSLAILFSRKKKNKIYLIEYKDECITRLKKILFEIIKQRINGIICSQESVGKKYGVPYVCVPDYIYTGESVNLLESRIQYDFGIVGRITPSKDIEEVVEHVIHSGYSLLIAGYFVDKNRYKKLKEKVNDQNIQIIDKYLNDEEYKRTILSCKYIVLPYMDDYYTYASSGVIYDIIFSMRPVICPDFRTFQFIKKYKMGVCYRKSFKEINMEELLTETENYERGIRTYLKCNNMYIEKLKKFILM